MIRLLIIVFFSISTLSHAQRYVKSGWVETGAFTDLEAVGFFAGLNLGLDDKFFNLNYSRLDRRHKSQYLNGIVELHHISLMANRQWELKSVKGLRFFFGGGFGVELGVTHFNTLTDQVEEIYPILVIPISIGFSYRLYNNFELMSRFRFTRKNEVHAEASPMLSLGIRLGILAGNVSSEKVME